MALQDYYNLGDDGQLAYSTTTWRGQTFTASSNYDLTSIKIKVYKTGSVGNTVVEVYATSGGLPTGSALSTGSIANTSLSFSATWTEITMSAFSPVSGTQYAITVHSTGSTCWWRRDATSPTYAGGTAISSSDSGSSWSSSPTLDYMFEVYGTSSIVIAPAEDVSSTLGPSNLTPAPIFDISTTVNPILFVSPDPAFDISATVSPQVRTGAFSDSLLVFPINFHAPGWIRHNEGHDPRHNTKTPIWPDALMSGSTSDEILPVQPIQNVSGVHRSAIHDFWYEKIHLLPRLVQELGNIISTQVINVELYNAHRTDDIIITSVTDNLDPGVVMTGVPVPPFTINSQRSLSAQVTINTTGGFNVDSSYTFHAEDSTSYTLYITGTRIVLFPIRPEAPLREHIIFDTTILEATDGSEQRIANRKNPRGMFEMTIKESRQRMEMLLFDRQSKIVATPAWHEPSFLTSDITAGDYTVNVNTTDYANFYVGGHAIVFKDEFTYDALLIDSMTSTSLTFDSPVTNNYSSSNKKIHVMPLMVAWFNHQVSAAKNVYNEQTFSIRLDVDATDHDIADASSWNTYDGKVFLDDPNMIDGNVLAEVLERKVLVLDNVTGFMAQHSIWERNKRRSFKGFKTNTREELWKLRKLLHYLKGQQVSFYIPTFSKDLIPNQTLVNTTSVFNMDNIGYTINARDRFPKDYFRMHLTNGTILTRGIVNSSEISTAVEQLTVDAPWPYDIQIDDIERIEFLEKIRINVDDIVITHYNALGQSKCFVPVKEVFD